MPWYRKGATTPLTVPGFSRTPRKCYRFIRRNIRTEWDTIDWDLVTGALDWKYQRRWMPERSLKRLEPYRNQDEVDIILDKHRDKLYAFIAPANRAERHLRDVIIIHLVRLSQR